MSRPGITVTLHKNKQVVILNKADDEPVAVITIQQLTPSRVRLKFDTLPHLTAVRQDLRANGNQPLYLNRGGDRYPDKRTTPMAERVRETLAKEGP